jgi:signal transduction histidine kinase
MKSQETRRRRILVVEDQELLRIAIRDILELEGYAVLTANDGVEALEVMEKVRPDLILADIMMPRMDGYTLYEQVRARPAWVPIPFIFLTARAEKEDVIKGKALGAEDYITKPFDPQLLVVAVRAKLGRAQAIREVTEAEFDELKQQIINVLSHELRTPLTSVCGYTELALEEASTLKPDEFQQFLTGIKRGADRLTRLVEDLLWLVRLDTGQVQEEFNVLGSVNEDVADVVSRIGSMYEAQAKSKGLILTQEIESTLPPVELYEPFLLDALGRLLDNAIKFTREEGKHVYLMAQAVDDEVQIAVRDEGIGMTQENVEQLFSRFGQINRSKMEQQGIGMGLVISQALVQIHNGNITIESKLGKGSVFTIHLPVAEGI